eukprot:jgi/Mesvir1/24157/Mv10874-RA.1
MEHRRRLTMVLTGVMWRVLDVACSYCLLSMGVVRSWAHRVRKSWATVPSQSYDVKYAQVSTESGERDITEAFLEVLRQRGGGVDAGAEEMMQSLGVAEHVAGSEKPCLLVRYTHAGKELAVTYNLKLTQKKIRFPPIRIASADEVDIPKTHKVLSATLGTWYPSPDNVDVTKGVQALLGEDGDFYAGAQIPQFIWCILRLLAVDDPNLLLPPVGENREQFLRIIYGDGRTLIFHPATEGCIVYSGVCQNKVLRPIRKPVLSAHHVL